MATALPRTCGNVAARLFIPKEGSLAGRFVDIRASTLHVSMQDTVNLQYDQIGCNGIFGPAE